MSARTSMALGDRVEVNWGRRGWLPGTFEVYESFADPGENFLRLHVRMDNGFSCDGSGYHPDAVRMPVAS
jgi:hypothetical protein